MYFQSVVRIVIVMLHQIDIRNMPPQWGPRRRWHDKLETTAMNADTDALVKRRKDGKHAEMNIENIGMSKCLL